MHIIKELLTTIRTIGEDIYLYAIKKFSEFGIEELETGIENLKELIEDLENDTEVIDANDRR